MNCLFKIQSHLVKIAKKLLQITVKKEKTIEMRQLDGTKDCKDCIQMELVICCREFGPKTSFDFLKDTKMNNCL